MLYDSIMAFLRHAQTRMAVMGKRKFLSHGAGLHIGKGSRLWAPDKLSIGNNVYIGKYVHIECNCNIGDFVLIANRAAMVGRIDHDFRAVGYPIRFAPWAGDPKFPIDSEQRKPVVIGSDVWIGYGAVILSGVHIGKGSLVAAGSVVVSDVPAYSIAGGNPARKIRDRFSRAQIEEHEARIKNGAFKFSEKGYDYWLAKPGNTR